MPALVEQILAGASSLKVHEDWGATPAVLDAALRVADEYDIQVSLHSDSLNEAGYVEDTLSAINGRTIHTYHTEGAGGGHAPDILRAAGFPHVLPSSTNPTLPYTVNSVDELLDMVMVCHHLSHDIPEDVAFADSRVRAETISAETVLQDEGVISMISSDSQAMGRVGESFTRAFQVAHHNKDKRGKLPEDAERNDNFRVLRYLAKVTINPAITQASRTTSGRWRTARSPTSCCGRWTPSRPSPGWCSRADDQLGADGRPERLAAHPAAGVLPPDVRCLRPGAAADPGVVHVPGRDRRRGAGAARAE